VISESTLNQRATRPAQLLLLGAPFSLRLCNRATVTVDGYTWAKHPLSASVSHSITGHATLQLTLGNLGYAHSATLRALEREVDVTLWSLYAADGTYETQERFSGTCISMTERYSNRGAELVAQAIPVGQRFRYSPRVRFDHPQFIGRGSKIIIGALTYVFE